MPGADLVERLGAWAGRLRERAVPAHVAPPLEVEAPAPGVARGFRIVSTVSAGLAFVVGYHVLLGWIFGIPLLATPTRAIPAMSPTEAAISLVFGAALLLPRLPNAGGLLGEVGRFAAALGTLVAFGALLENILGAPLGLAPGAPGEPLMPTFSAVAWLAVGCGILALDSDDLRAVQLFGVGAAGLGILAITCYVYRAPPLPGGMPLYSAIASLLTAAALVCFHPDRGLLPHVTSNSFGGMLARRLLPASLLVPLVLGWLQATGYRLGDYPWEAGLAWFSVANVAVFVAVVWGSVVSLHRMDAKRREAERVLSDTAAKLARSNADLEQFAYVASHDLKEPLRAVGGSVQVLQARFGDQLGPDAEELIRHTVDGANRMQTLIDDLLTYSRLTTREAPLEPTDAREVLDEALANLEVSVRENRAVVTADPLPVVRADRTQLVQVFQNLVSNALKYRSERTPRIHVGVEETAREWVFSVRDNGIGIAPQYADRIFKLFQRLHTRRDYPGTGIGLAVCKKVVERHGGRIWVESEPEEGSTFFFSLPKT